MLDLGYSISANGNWTRQMPAKKKTKKKVAQRKQKLELELITTCDSVSRDPNNNKSTLYGLFDNIAVEKFPCVSPTFSLFAQLKGNGDYDIDVEFISPNGKSEDLAGVSIKCVADRLSVVVATISGLQFDKPGDYQLAIKYGRRRLPLTKRLRVTKIKRGKA